MEGSSTKKSTSLETLVIQNISNVNELKSKLNEIIKTGTEYEYDVSSCLKVLLNSSDHEIVLLSVQAVAELAKCEEKRESYAQKEIIQPILNILQKDLCSDNIEVIKHCCRSLGNLCCDCDTSRTIILENDGVKTLVNLIRRTLQDRSGLFEEIEILGLKSLLNFAIGGQEFSESIVEKGLLELLHNILVRELEKDDMDDGIVSTVILICSVINDNQPDYLFSPEINTAIFNILKETTNVEVSGLLLDHLHSQAEHDSVKELLASLNAVQLVCTRLEHLVARYEAGDLNADSSDVEQVMKHATDLVIIVLTSDEAMHSLYQNGVGEVYLTMVSWLESTNHHLLTTAVLAIGNFARQDDYCVNMMDSKIFDKLLDIFEVYNGFHVKMQQEPNMKHPIDPIVVTKIQHAVLSALRNLLVPAVNKRAAAARGRAAPIFLKALPTVGDHHVAYKLLAAIRMLVDGQESVAQQLLSDSSALSSVASWGAGSAGGGGGAAGEAPRLLAWAVKAGGEGRLSLTKVDGCISSLVNMLVVCHSVMQNEAILALTLIAIQSLNQSEKSTKTDNEKNFISQLITSEIGKHVSLLIETNCAKMPIEVAENLLAFLDITAKKHDLAKDYKENKVPETLQKFKEGRKDINDDHNSCILGVISAINENSKE